LYGSINTLKIKKILKIIFKHLNYELNYYIYIFSRSKSHERVLIILNEKLLNSLQWWWKLYYRRNITVISVAGVATKFKGTAAIITATCTTIPINFIITGNSTSTGTWINVSISWWTFWSFRYILSFFLSI